MQPLQDAAQRRPRALKHASTTCAHDLASRLICQKCRSAGKRPPAELLQLGKRERYAAEKT
jgi:hypothetical protein